ncbi:extracellular solute-binding protein [Candidatus Epulonipiscium viviparus]|uniref:extracellular solute-binding protein n=1 Tax=Candidatus Epulonipiscium viviparus TaxID=420336 RepID=UPI00273806C8|nr:extracellular solute-binding protein [Candidatus Epulopiscium viviparus]
MNIKKFLLTAMTAISISATLIGCGGDTDSAATVTDNLDLYTPLGTYPVVKEGVDISFTAFAPLLTNITTYAYDTNLFTKHFQDLTGVEIEWVECTSADKKQKFNVMMTGGDYTDVILEMQNTLSELSLYGSQGIFIPLNDLIDQYMPNLKAVLEKNPHVVDAWTATDGNIYSLPKISGSLNNQVGNKMWMNQVWLDNLGLEVPTNIDEFYNVLKAFKEQDANGNGDPNDEIPLTGSYKSWAGDITLFIGNMFQPMSNSSKFLNIDEDGQIFYAKSTDEWKEALKFMNKLHDEGLFDPMYFSQTSDQLIKLASNPAAAVVGTTVGGSVTVFANTTNHERWGQYTWVPPIEGPTGLISTAHTPDFGKAVLSITNRCENPIAVARMFDYMYDAEGKGTFANEYGLEGTGRYRLAEEGTKNYVGGPAEVINLSADAAKDVSWGGLGPGYHDEDWLLMFGVSDKPSEEVGYLLYRAGQDYIDHAQDIDTMIPPLAFDLDDSRILVDVETNLGMYLDQATADFITGKVDIDEGWDDYLEQLNNIGINQYISVHQEALDLKLSK